MVRAYHLRHRTCQRNAVCVPCRTASKCSLCPTCGGEMTSIRNGVPKKDDDAGWKVVEHQQRRHYYANSRPWPGAFTNILPKMPRMKGWKGYLKESKR